jgi:hypothetical protein
MTVFMLIISCGVLGGFSTYAAIRSRAASTDSSHRSSDSASAAVEWYKPIIPQEYLRSKQPFDTVVVLGDASALCSADALSKQASWSELLLKLLGNNKGQRLMKCSDGINCGLNLERQLTSVAQLSPTGKIPGKTAVLIQTGADALIECIATRSCTAENIVAQITDFVHNITAEAAAQYFSAGEPEVYVFDYPDATTGSGYIATTQLPCTVPFLRTPVSGAVGYFNSLSQMLASSAQRAGFAFVPLRFVLARHGAQRDYVLATTATHRKSVDVLGAQTAATERVFASCLYLDQIGQLFQAQLAYAFLTRKEFTQAF